MAGATKLLCWALARGLPQLQPCVKDTFPKEFSPAGLRSCPQTFPLSAPAGLGSGL